MLFFIKGGREGSIDGCMRAFAFVALQKKVLENSIVCYYVPLLIASSSTSC